MQFRSNVIRRITTISGLIERKIRAKSADPVISYCFGSRNFREFGSTRQLSYVTVVNALIARHLVLEPIGNQLLPSRSSKVKLSCALLCQIQFRNYFDFMTTMIYIHRYQKRVSVLSLSC